MGYILRPRIPITLSYNGKSMDIVALLDSGSDFTIIPRDIAEVLGMDLSGKAEEIDGIGGKEGIIRSQVNVTIQKGTETHRFPNILVFVSTSERNKDIIVGRIPIFMEFDITFKENSNRIILTRSRRG